MINPVIVEGQIHGGVAQGVGGGLLEEMVYDEQTCALAPVWHSGLCGEPMLFLVIPAKAGIQLQSCLQAPDRHLLLKQLDSRFRGTFA